MWHLARQVFEQGRPAGAWRAFPPLELDADIAVEVSGCPYRLDGMSAWLLRFSRGDQPFQVHETVNQRGPNLDPLAGRYALIATRTGMGPYACSIGLGEELQRPRPRRFLGVRSGVESERLWSVERTFETAVRTVHEFFLFDPGAAVVLVERELVEKDLTE